MVLEVDVELDTPDGASQRGRGLDRDLQGLVEGIRAIAARSATDYRNLLTLVADQIADARTGTSAHGLLAQLASETQREASQRKQAEERLRGLAEVSREFASSTHELGLLLDLVACRLGELLGDMCAIRATSDDGEWLEETGAVYHRDPRLLALTREATRIGRQRIGEGVSGRAALTGEASLVKHVDLAAYSAAALPAYRSLVEQLGASSVITLPLRYRGKVVGVANLLRGPGSAPYDESDLAFAQSLAEHAAVAIANARAHAAERSARLAAERATSALTQAEARLARLSESGVLGIVVGTLDGKIVEVNDTLLAMLGYARDDILSGKVQWSDLTPAEWSEVDTRAMARLQQQGVGGLREKELLRRDGTRAPVLIDSAMLGDDSRECISFVLDLSARKEAEAAVAMLREQRDADDRLRGLLESGPDAMVIADAAGTIVLVNRQVENLFGYTREELIGQPVEILVPERLRAAHPAHRADYHREPSVRSMRGELELHGRRKDGSEFVIEVSLSPVQTKTGMLVSSSIRDITERKKAEQQRASLAAIVSASDDAIIGKTTTGVITSWNHGAERIFGYTAEEIIGQPIMRLIPPGCEAEEHEILRAVGGGKVMRFDARRRRKDGSEIAVSVTSSPVRDVDGRVIGIAKVARDISDRREAEAALVVAKDAAEAASRELEAFSYSVAHDLRAPLRGMNGFAQILLEDYGGKLDAEGLDCLHEIHGNAKRMGELIDALLSLSRTTRADLRPQQLDLSELVGDIVSELAASTPERAVKVAVQEHLSVYMDPTLTRVLFDNLLGNAWKFTSKIAQPQIEVGAVVKDGVRTVFVRDNGAGFEMAHVGKLFAPFQRLHTMVEFAGTGIGLATVQRIAHRHGARVWADGKVGEGAVFYLGLPASCWGSP